MAKEKTRNGGLWTEARFESFIKGNLRRASMRWGPISACLTRARVGRGEYRCDGCGLVVPATTKDEETGKRVKNIHADHIDPVIDPQQGFVSWDSVIERLFVEIDKLQALCHSCHSAKSNQERAQAKERRAGDKLEREEE